MYRHTTTIVTSTPLTPHKNGLLAFKYGTILDVLERVEFSLELRFLRFVICLGSRQQNLNLNQGSYK